MERKCKMNKTQINCTKTEEGESIEQMLRRLCANKQPIPDNVPELFTAKADGVLPNTDIRTDRFDIAAEAKDMYDRSEIAKSAKLGDFDEPLNTEEKEK